MRFDRMRFRWPLAWRTDVDRLAAALIAAEDAQNAAAAEVARARAEADALQVCLADRTGAADLARARKTLVRYDNLLAGYEGRPAPYCRRCEPQTAPTTGVLL